MTILAFEAPTIHELFEFKPIWVLHVGSLTLDITFPTLLMFAMTILVMGMFVGAFRRPALVPKGFQNVVEAGTDFIREGIAVSVIGAEGAVWTPLLAAIFFWILFNNLMSIIPGISFPVTSRMAYPATLAVLVWIIFNVVGIKEQGFFRYFKNIMFPPGVPMAIKPLLALIEFFSTVIVRPITLSVRLFANMVAGHMILGVLFLATAVFFQSGLGKATFILPFGLATALMGLELFVIFMQAFIFTILTAVYIAGALHPEH